MPLAFAAVGLSPGSGFADNVLRSGYAQISFKLSSSEEGAMVFSAQGAGGIKDWLSFLPSGNFTLPAKSSIDLTVVVQPPADAQNGVYNGSAKLVARPAVTPQITGSGSLVVLSVEAPVSVRIVDTQIVLLSVDTVTVSSVEEGAPAVFKVVYVNGGNVRVKPLTKIDVFDRTGAKVKTVEFSDANILPTAKQTILVNVSTTDLRIGSYNATVTCSLGDRTLAERLLSFDVTEIGALRREGELLALSSSLWATVGDALKVTAVFKNKGSIPVTAKFVGEVSLNGRLVSPLASEEITVGAGETADLVAYFTPREPGQFLVEGHVVYSRMTTQEKNFVINVKAAIQAGNEMFYYAVAGVVVLLAVVLYVVLKRKKPAKK